MADRWYTGEDELHLADCSDDERGDGGIERSYYDLEYDLQENSSEEENEHSNPFFYNTRLITVVNLS